MFGSALRTITATLAFILELAMLVSFALWGAHVSPNSALGGLLAGLMVISGAAVLGTFLAPRAPRRLAWPRRIQVEILLMTAAAVALLTTGRVEAAVIFAAATVVRLALGLATGLDRLDEPGPGAGAP